MIRQVFKWQQQIIEIRIMKTFESIFNSEVYINKIFDHSIVNSFYPSGLTYVLVLKRTVSLGFFVFLSTHNICFG